MSQILTSLNAAMHLVPFNQPLCLITLPLRPLDMFVIYSVHFELFNMISR